MHAVCIYVSMYLCIYVTYLNQHASKSAIYLLCMDLHGLLFLILDATALRHRFGSSLSCANLTILIFQVNAP